MKRRGPMEWLANRSRRFWFVAAALLVVSYPFSLGPGVYMFEVLGEPWWLKVPFMATYAPIFLAATCAPLPISDAINWYFELWVQLAVG